jgi:hypothetical protein
LGLYTLEFPHRKEPVMALKQVPRGATVRTDDEGEYVAYHVRCNWNDCGIELTSRNRTTTGARRCKPCGLEAMRDAAARARDGLQPADNERLKKPPGGPERQAIHHLLTAFLAHPTVKELKDRILAALVDHELKERFRTL